MRLVVPNNQDLIEDAWMREEDDVIRVGWTSLARFCFDWF